MEQQSMQAIEREKARIQTALALLEPDGEIESTMLHRYSPWRELDQVPAGELPRLRRYLEEEAASRKMLGDEKYFANLTGYQRMALHRRALDALAERAETDENVGRRMEEIMTCAEFRRYLHAGMVACPAVEPPPAKAPPKKKPAARKKPKAARFVPPTEDEVAAYCKEKGYSSVNPAGFIAFYESNGWKVGKNKMQKWRSAVAGWQIRDGAAPGGETVGRGQNLQPVGRAVQGGDILADARGYRPAERGVGAENAG